MKARADVKLDGAGWRRVGTLSALALVSTATSLGCGSSGDSFSEFEGTWRVDFTDKASPPSTATIDCPSTFMGNLDLWEKLVLEKGTLSDLVETTGPSLVAAAPDCQFAFDVDKGGKVARALTMDPYTMEPSQCIVVLDSGADANGDSHVAAWTMIPNTAAPPAGGAATDTGWRFSLLQPKGGAPPPAQLSGTGSGVLEDRNTSAGTAAVIDNCTYNVSLTLEKISKP